MYEDWFVENPNPYESELEAIRAVLPKQGRGVEIGVGSGLFSKPLGIAEGVEPAHAMAERARRRGITVYEGVAEDLPLASNAYDFALMVTTICFVDDFDASMVEMARVIKPDGRIVLAFVDSASPLGQMYEKYKEEDPFYRKATFYSAEEVVSILRKHGFEPKGTAQTVFGPLDKVTEVQQWKQGTGEGGFVVISAGRAG
jgi:SAM-dependent methyltransferase